LARRLATDHHHCLADGLGLDRPAYIGRIRVAQQVHGQCRIGLECRYEVAQLALFVLGEGQHALNRAIHHRQSAAVGDRVRAERGDLRVEL
jgi:hypothetical protein